MNLEHLFNAIKINNYNGVEIILKTWQQKKAQHSYVHSLHNNIEDAINQSNFHGMTPLYLAVILNHEKIVQLLLDFGADPNRALTTNGETPLFAAVRKGFKNSVKRLLDKKANPNTPPALGAARGMPPLIMATRNACINSPNEHEDIAKILIENGARQDVVYQDTPPLYQAVISGNKRMTRLLLKSGANVNFILPSGHNKGATVIYLAAEKGNIDIVKILIEAGANFNLATSDKKTPLFIAAERGHYDIFELLLAYGAGIGGKIPASIIENKINFNFANKIIIGLDIDDTTVTSETPGFEHAITTIDQFKQRDEEFYHSHALLFQTLKKNDSPIKLNITKEIYHSLYLTLRFHFESLVNILITGLTNHHSRFFALHNSAQAKRLPLDLLEKLATETQKNFPDFDDHAKTQHKM